MFMNISKKIDIDETEKFNNKMHTYGRISTSIIMLMLLSMPLIMSLVFDVNINLKTLFKSCISA